MCDFRTTGYSPYLSHLNSEASLRSNYERSHGVTRTTPEYELSLIFSLVLGADIKSKDVVRLIYGYWPKISKLAHEVHNVCGHADRRKSDAAWILYKDRW
jgi:hypothetical protein